MASVNSGEKYSNCISLGWFCGTACSLSRLGLRSCAGPFDWYFSHYWSVLSQIENGFCDFMKPENLELDKEDMRGHTFVDKRYQFRCNHDIQENLEAEKEIIHQRYAHKADTFQKMIVRPTVFVRCIRDPEEVEYINVNWEYAQKVLKKYNSKNDVIYVYRKGLKGLTDNVTAFSLEINDYVGKKYEMRHMFDSSCELLKLCSGLLDEKTMQKNIAYDRRKFGPKS